MIGGRVASAVAGVLAVVLLAGGCLRAQIVAAVQSDDTVTGEMVIASVANAGDNGGNAALTPPPDLASQVRTQPYQQDGYVGTRLLFTALSFEDFGRLGELAGGDAPNGKGNRIRLQIRRSGDLVLFTGRVDLVQIPAPERVDVGLRMSFPGRLADTNGQQTGNEVYWHPAPGEITELTATARYADPNTKPWTQWAAMVGGIVAAAVLIVLLLALLTHRWSIRRATDS